MALVHLLDQDGPEPDDEPDSINELQIRRRRDGTGGTISGRFEDPIHASEWMVRIRNGLPEFIPPRWIDPDQTPRRRPQRS